MKGQLSQLFRNKRRKSEPKTQSSSKLVSIPSARLSKVFTKVKTSAADDCMVVPGAFERNHAKLIAEFSRKNPNHAFMIQLLKETFTERRKAIESSSLKTTDLLKEYPYFSEQQWVRFLLLIIREFLNFSLLNRSYLNSLKCVGRMSLKLWKKTGRSMYHVS